MLRKNLFGKFIATAALMALMVGVFSPTPAEASQVGRQRVFGLGGMVGETSGGTGKLFISDIFALQFGTAFKGWHQWLLNYIDFVWHPWHITSNRHYELHFYFGVGPALGLRPRDDWDRSFWVRVPFGVSFRFEKIPLEAFGESGPMPGVTWERYAQGNNYVVSDGDFRFQWFWSTGARWYF